MAISELGPNVDISIFPAHETMMASTGDDSTYVGRIVCMNVDEEVCFPTAISDIPCGILIEGNVTGGYVTYRAFGVVPVKMNDVVAVPNCIAITNLGGVIDGRAGTAISTCHIVGQILEHSDAENDIVTCIVNCISPSIKV